MSRRHVIRGLAAARVALGAGLVLAPGVAARTWFGRDDGGLRLTLRSIGARDVAMGVGLLAAGADTGPWLAAGVTADLVDAAASTRAIGDLPPGRIVPGTALALGFAAAGAWAAAGSGRSAP